MAYVPTTTFAGPKVPEHIGKPARYRYDREASQATIAKLVAHEIRMRNVIRRQEVYQLLEEVGKPVESKYLLEALQLCQSRVSTLLAKLVKAGNVLRVPISHIGRIGKGPGFTYLYSPIKPPPAEEFVAFIDAAVEGTTLAAYIEATGINEITIRAYARRQVYAGIVSLDAKTGIYKITEFGKQFSTEGRKLFIQERWKVHKCI